MSYFKNNSSETENSSCDDKINVSPCQDILRSKYVFKNNVNKGTSSLPFKKNVVSIYLFVI